LNDFNSQDYNLKLGEQVEIIGQIRSDFIPTSAPKFGTLDMFPKYYFKFAIDNIKQNKTLIKDISEPIKVNTSLTKNLAYGSRIKIIGQLEESNYINFTYEMTSEKIWLINQPNLMNRTINTIRNNFILNSQKINSEGSELLPGLILGDTRYQSKVLKEDMKLSGLTHLTAVSGGNIAILIIALSFLLRKFKINLKIEIFLIFLFLLFFTFLVRAEPSVIRASLMASIVLISILYGTLKQGINALLITICVALLLDPKLATSWGFTLSVFATFGLLLLTEPILNYLIRNFPWLNQNLLIIISVALAAQFSTMGLVAGFTGLISIWSVFANTLVSPVVPIVTILGYLGLVLSNFNSSFALIFNFAASVFANWIVMISHYFANREFSIINIPSGILGFLMANIIVLVIVFLLKKFKILFIIITILVTLISIFSVKYLFFDTKWPIKNWQFVMCDVGQGDGLVIKDSMNKTIVVDVGPDGKLMTNCLRKLGIKQIDILLLTHFHLDHVEGLKEVIKNHQIKTVFASWIKEPHEESVRVEKILGSTKIEYLISGQKIRLGEIELTCLWPMTKKMEIESIANNSSLVVVAEIDNASILLTGDVEPPAQQVIRNIWKSLYVDVIKIPHHGSKFQDDLFPIWSGARLALISAGADNTYGHPSKEAIDLYEKSKMTVLSSNMNGSVSIFINEHDQIAYTSTG
jgi:competence protein ComEC